MSYDIILIYSNRSDQKSLIILNYPGYLLIFHQFESLFTQPFRKTNKADMLLSYSRVRLILYSILISIIALSYALIIFRYTELDNSAPQLPDRSWPLSAVASQLNWIVVTSINQPTKEIARLAQQKHFQLLVVGDEKSPKNWTFPNAIFLSETDQRQLGYSILQSTPSNSYNRKNVGYLFALRNGARFIYDTDDDNAPIWDLAEYFDLDEYDTGLVLTNTGDDSIYVNPYSHFGQPTIWPRGFPLSQINKPVQVGGSSSLS